MSEQNQQLLVSLVEKCRVIVCCGAGGVGKTTTASALELGAARLGRKVLFLTIDPSRRLAETLGVSRNPPAPVPLSKAWQAAAGIAEPGMLHAWMLDPKLVSDESVRRFMQNDGRARGIIANRIYQQATTMVAGLHEYTAMKALQQFIVEDAYDLVVLDTPPSRNALDFLDAPTRLAGFLDGAIFRMFVPSSTGIISRAATGLISRIVSAVFGKEFTEELSTFLRDFSELFASLNGDLLDVRKRLQEPDCAFVLVTSASDASVVEAEFFHERIVQLGLPFRGFVLNRSHARESDQKFPSVELLPPDASPALHSAIEKLKWLARKESLHGQRDRGLLADLALRAGTDAFAIALPSFRTDANDLSMLLQIAKLVLDERRSGPR